ncbi:MAG: glycosyltransferase family 4 protein [Planctomycetaceae bacterium]|nr:glycosyltransferase family 4 protein [Planctomycetaceae bacterium]
MAARNSILIVAPSAYTLGGLAVWVDYLIPGLRQLGWDVTLGLVSGPRHHNVHAYLQVYPIPNSIAIHCSCSTNTDRIQAVRGAIRTVNPDIVLTANIPHAIRATGLERSEGRNVKAVMSCHGIQEDLFADMRLLHSELDAVVCTNRLACRLSEELGQIDAERIFHCACGTAVPVQMPDPPQNQIFTIGFSGRIEQPQKRIFDLIEIAQQLKNSGSNFKILVAGSGPELQRFTEEITRRGFDQHFELLGFVPANEMHAEFYAKLDALLVTSSWETGPIVIWEAMAAAVPVVTSRYIGSGVEGILTHEKNCLMFDIADCKKAAESLKSLHNVALQKTLRANGFETATELLSHQTSVANWDRILHQILAMDSPTDPVAPEIYTPCGRLDRLLGSRLATRVRTAIGRLPPNTGPSGEWPHTMAGACVNEEEFFRLVLTLEQSNLHRRPWVTPAH